MDVILRRTLLGLLIGIFFGVVFHAPLSVWLGTIFPEAHLEIKAWKEILLLLSVTLVAIEITRAGWWRKVLSDWVIRIAIAYSLLHLLLLPFIWKGTDVVTAALMIDLRFIVFFVVMYVACRIYPTWRKPIIISGIIAAALSLLFAVLQITVLPHDILMAIGYSKDTIAPYMTVDQNYSYIRINGTLRGPNPLGIYSAIVLAGSLSAILFKRRHLASLHNLLPYGVGILAVFASIALWFTYSRSALLAAIVAVGIILLVRYGGYINRKIWIALGLASLALVGGVYITRDTQFVSQVILHEDPDEGGDFNSNDGHLESLIDGTERMLRQPFGAGVGSTGSPSLMTDEGLIIENYYLYVAHETGWLGLILFVILQGVVLYGLWLRRSDWLACGLFASGVGFIVASLFLPVWADDTVSMVWWGLAGVALVVLVKKKKEVRHG